MHYIPYLLGIIAILAGLKTVITQEVTLSIQLWGNSRGSPPNSNDQVYATSQQTGFVAVLIGIVMIAIGVGMLLQGPGLIN